MYLLIVIGGLVAACQNPHLHFENTPQDYSIIPKVNNIEPIEGRFILHKNLHLSFDSTLEKEATYLSEILHDRYGIDCSLLPEGKAELHLTIDSSYTEQGSYKLHIQALQLNISGGSNQAVFYGIQSLLQLISTDLDPDITVPCALIQDEPRFQYRGMHLDVCRHFYDINFIKRYIDILALHKINRFHWHLTEDQGWRIEIKALPELTKVGAWRNGTITGHYPGDGNDNIRYGGFYTQEQVKEILAFAKSRHIEVIPEIELPGHSSAAIAAYPELSCFPDEATVIPNEMASTESVNAQKHGQVKLVQESWGVYKDVYCAGKESTFELIQKVLDEVIELFPSEYIHIGGDECPKANWKECPHCQRRIKTEGLKDEHELQSYFIKRIEQYINSKGRKIIGWDEILEGGLAPNATVMSWRGNAGGIEAANANHNVIMTPNSHCYFDHYQSEDIDNEPLAIGGFLPVSKVYDFDPVPEDLDSSQHKYILGGQANLWTEYIKTEGHAEYMLLPRLAALSESVWTYEQNKDFEDFTSRMLSLRKLYDKLDYSYSTHLFE